MRTLPAWALAIALCVLGPGAFGCRRATNSPEYAEAQGLHDRLVTQDGDQAYVSPEMDRVEQLLRSVPENSLDAAAAQTLLAKVSAERTRVREAAAAPAPSELPPPSMDAFPEPATDSQAQAEQGTAEADAGLPGPVSGMPLADFQRQFGGCFVPGQDLLVAGLGTRPTYELRDLPSCQQQYADYRSLVVLIDNGAVAGFAQKQAMRLALPDGGQAPEQPAQPAPQAQPRAQPAPAPTPDPSQVTVPPAPPQDQSARDYQGIKY